MSSAQNFAGLGSQITEEVFLSLNPAQRRMLLHQALYFDREKKRNMLPFFIPNGSQEKFIAMVGNHPVTGKKIFIYPAANGIGKSCVVINVLAACVYGKQSRWYDQPLWNMQWPYPKRIWFISEPDALQNNLVDEIKLWLPKKTYVSTKGGRKFDSQFEFVNGWTMSIKTFDQDVTQFESDNVGIIIYNEPPPRQIRSACVSRLRMGGFEMFAMTPLSHSAWIFDELIDKDEQQKNVDVLYGDIEENCIEHGVRGILHHEFIQYLASQYDEDEAEARLHGKPKHLAGVIYKTLHPQFNRHWQPASDFDQQRHDIYCVMDPHDRRPPAIVWFAVRNDGKKFAVAEYPNDPAIQYHTIKSTSLTYKDIGNIIYDIEKKNGWESQRVRRYMDPNYGPRQVGALGKTIQQFYAEMGLYFTTEIIDDIATGHAAVKNLLTIDNDGQANLKIGDELHNSWHQLSRYGIKEHSAKKLETDGLSEKVAPKFKDFSDCFRYFAMIVQPYRQIAEIKPHEPKTRETDPAPGNGSWENDWRNPFAGRRTITRILR